MAKPYKILGLDIGIGSCGWALLDMRGERIVDMGVHLWDVPQEPKTKESLAAARRSARSARRNTKRRSDRAKHCLALLKEHGLIPDDASKEWFQTVKGDPQPLESRVAALDSLVSDRHLAQALYNICNRRGYIPHGEGGSSEESEGKKVLSAIDANSALLAEKGYRTVGEMMLKEGQAQGATCGISRNKAGDYSRCLTLAQLLEEVEAIFSAQRSLGNPKVTAELQSDFIACMTWEKDTADHDQKVYDSVGPCVYLPGEHRGAKACISFERCAAFERVSHVRMVTPDGVEYPLPAEVRRWCMDTLFSPTPLKGNKECKVTFKALRKRLDMSAACSFKGIDIDQEKSKEIAEPKVWRKERSILPTELLRRMLEDCDLGDAIGSALAYSSTEANLRAQLELLPLSEAEIEAICALPFSSKAFSGYGNRSVKALQMLCDAFEDFESVNSLFEAEEASGLYYQRAKPLSKGRRLPPYTDFDETCRNPVVLRVMGRVRKLVNAVIATYGMPDEIHIELARDLKQSQKEKAKIDKANKDRENKRRIAKNRLAEDLGCPEDEVSGKLLRKYELWVEQQGIDVYTGEPIQYERMLSDSTYCQIDHILPYSRTCDDSQSNKVLALASSNQQKRERSPYEWLAEEGNWDVFQARVISMGQQGYPFRKRQKLLERDLAGKQDGFIERNLNDTRYATKAAKDYIERYLQFPAGERTRHVVAVAGGATSALRSSWGFAKKDRAADDCHHAADAAVIAACDESAVIKIAKASERKHLVPKEQRAMLFADTEPWEGFARQVEELCAALIPTRKVDRGGTARLFEDTVYSFRGMNPSGTKALMNVKGKSVPKGNYVLRADGSALLPDGQAFLRLWWDSERKTFLREIVYFADLAAMRNGAYIPRYFTTTSSRPQWPAVPERVLASTKPIVIRYGDAVCIGDEVLRYRTCSSSTGALAFSSMRNFKQDVSPKTIPTKLKEPGLLKVLEEDILGQCYRRRRDSQN